MRLWHKVCPPWYSASRLRIRAKSRCCFECLPVIRYALTLNNTNVLVFADISIRSPRNIYNYDYNYKYIHFGDRSSSIHKKKMV